MAGVDDAPDVARLLHDFNTEYDDPVPEVGGQSTGVEPGSQIRR